MLINKLSVSVIWPKPMLQSQITKTNISRRQYVPTLNFQAISKAGMEQNYLTKIDIDASTLEEFYS